MMAMLTTSLGLLLGVASSRDLDGDATAVIPAVNPSKSCMTAIRGCCDGKYQESCQTCAGNHAQELIQAGCTNADIRDICDNGLLASVNLTIGHNYSDLVLEVGHVNDDANGVNHTFRDALPSSMCFDSTDDPDNYFVYGHRLSFLQAGGLRVDQALLQLRATGVDTGVLGTSVSLNFAAWTSSFGNDEPCDAASGNCWPKLQSNISCADRYGCQSPPLTSTNLRIGQTFHVHEWNVKLNGICEN
jgi:hypothetical protein